MTGDGGAASGERLNDHRGRLDPPNVDLQVVDHGIASPRCRYSAPPARCISLRLRHFFQATLMIRAMIAIATMIVSAWAPPEVAVPGTEFQACAGEINNLVSYEQCGGMLK